MDLGRARPRARAAGVTGMAANVLLVAFYAVEAGRRRVLPVPLGSANDVVGAVGTALTVPVVLAVSPGRWAAAWGSPRPACSPCPDRRSCSDSCPSACRCRSPSARSGGLSGWILLSSRALRGTLPDEVTRLGVLSGGGVLASGVVTGGALLLPRASVLRRATLAVGAAPVVLGMLAVRVVPASRPGAGDRRVEPMAVPSLPGLGVARQGPPEGSRRRRLGPLEDRARCAADRPCV